VPKLAEQSLIHHIPQENAEVIFISYMDFPAVKSDVLETGDLSFSNSNNFMVRVSNSIFHLHLHDPIDA
jgi:hypothetical protein